MYKNCTKNVPKNVPKLVQNDTWYMYVCMYVHLTISKKQKPSKGQT